MRSFEGGALYQISGTRVSGRFYGSSEKGRSSTVAPRPLYRPIFARTRGRNGRHAEPSPPKCAIRLAGSRGGRVGLRV